MNLNDEQINRIVSEVVAQSQHLVKQAPSQGVDSTPVVSAGKVGKVAQLTAPKKAGNQNVSPEANYCRRNPRQSRGLRGLRD